MRTLNRSCLASMLCLVLAMFGHSVAADTPAETASIYELELSLTDQSGSVRQIDLHRGHATLVTMFYGRCPMACPLLIDTLRAIEAAIPEAERRELRVLMVSIDPEHDTPAALAALAKARRLDPQRWTVAQVPKSDVRLLAAVLNVQYRELPDGQYNHTSVISLVDADGIIRSQTTVLGTPEPQFVAEVRRLQARNAKR